MAQGVPLNTQVSTKLLEAAALLEQQRASAFRVDAYRRAADTVERLDESVGALLERDGTEGLELLPGVGRSIAKAIREIVKTGRWLRLERIRGELDPERLFRSLPGVGPVLARRIHEELHVDTLETLEAAAHDGRLQAVAGVGARRVLALRAELASMLHGPTGHRPEPSPWAPPREPTVDELLDVDREYRARAAARALATIAPKRFNPGAEAWLPILHTERGPWHFTALFSNTARAHRLGKTRDHVVLYFHDDAGHERQRTVVTETSGALAGRRVVRGRENETRTTPYRGVASSDRPRSELH